MLDQDAQKKYDQFAVSNRLEVGNAENNLDDGLQTSDVSDESMLRSPQALDEQIDRQLAKKFSTPSERMLVVRGLPSDNVRAAMRFGAGTMDTKEMQVRLVVERVIDCEAHDGALDVGNRRVELVDRIQRISPKLLSTGKFWSLDEELECEVTSRLD